MSTWLGSSAVAVASAASLDQVRGAKVVLCGGTLTPGLWPKLEMLLGEICKEDPDGQLDFGQAPTAPPVAVQVEMNPMHQINALGHVGAAACSISAGTF